MEKEYLIKKWLANELSVEEQQAFDALDDAPEFHRIMEAAKHFKASNFSTPSSFEALEDRIDNRKPVRYLRWTKPLLRLAGVFVVGIGIYFLFFFNNLTQVQTLASEKTTIQLPDASTATLNALSEISYSKNRWDAERKVNLNGEAFFKVAKGKRFDVITSEGIVTVVGTEFNVKQRGDYFEVNCFEGIVRVTAGETENELSVGDTFRIFDGAVSMSETTFTVPQWTKNVSDFKAVPFSEVLAELERQYDITVSFNTSLKNRLFSGGFVHDNLDHALRSISEPLGLSFIKEAPNKVRLEPRGQ